MDIISKEPQISLASAIKQAQLLQKLFRGFKDRHKWRRRVLLEAWDELERREESELHYSAKELGKMTKMYKKLSETAAMLTEDKPGGVDRRPSIVTARDSREKKKVEKAVFTPTLSWLTDFMDKCAKICAEESTNKREQKSKQMDESLLVSLLAQTKEELKKLPNVVDVKLSGKKNRLLVVGDLHGQVQDLLHILKVHGLPTAEKRFLFNGDFVDRGRHAVEVVIILFTLKLLFKDFVFLNRGNHEADDINARDGFQDECHDKYNQKVYEAFNDAFTALPLVHIVNQKTMVVHGGLCWDAGVTIPKIQQIDRFCLHPVWESVMEDLLWSDPGGPKHNGASQNDRGCGCIFGEDIVDEFFDDNPPLNFIIRSHEKKEHGFEKHFHGKLVTIFSASNYCGDNGNDGAVLELFPSLEYKIHTFYATPQREGDIKFSDRYCTLSASVAAKLIHRIAENRLALLDYYSKCVNAQSVRNAQDIKEDIRLEPGKINEQALITRVDWAKGLKEVLGLRIRFLFLQDLLGVPLVGAKGKKKGKFNYVEWLTKFAPSNELLSKTMKKKGGNSSTSSTLEKITNILLSHRVATKAMFRYFDTNGDGIVTPEELETGLTCLSTVYKENFDQADVKTLVRQMDADGNGSIDYAEFLATFTVSSPELSKALKSVPVENIMRGARVTSLNSGAERPRRDARAH